MEERTEYRSYIIFWHAPELNDVSWAANITSGSPSFFPAMLPDTTELISGDSRDEMLANAKLYIDGLLERQANRNVA